MKWPRALTLLFLFLSCTLPLLGADPDCGCRVRCDCKPCLCASQKLIGQSTPASWVAGKSYQGTEITADLPLDQMLWNIGSKVDGAGMCVTSSVEMAARYAGMEEYRGFRDYCAQYPGGAYPSKLAQQIKDYAAKKGIPAPEFIQYEGPNPEPILTLANQTGRMSCITYGYSPRYGSGGINHMTCCPLFTDKFAICLDNNAIGGVQNAEDKRYEWMDPAELVKRTKTAGDRFGRRVSSPAWVFVWLTPLPPPPPSN